MNELAALIAELARAVESLDANLHGSGETGPYVTSRWRQRLKEIAKKADQIAERSDTV